MSDPIYAWLDVESRVLKAASVMETAFIAVNLAHTLVPYRQAALWRRDQGLLALSGAANVDAGSPYVLWLQHLLAGFHDDQPRPLTQTDSGAEWAEWLPAHGLLLPFDGGFVFYARDDAFSEGEIAMLERLTQLVGLSLRALTPKRINWPKPRGRKGWAMMAAGVLVALFPVTSSVLAPAESVAAHPVLVRAPLEGVIGRMAVRPNDAVTEGQVLFELDATTLTGRLDVARQSLATAEAEYRQTAQAMVFDAKAKTQAAILAGKAGEKAAEVRLLESQLARIQVKAPKAGIAVFDDVADWIGRPVILGEKIMAVADETDTEVEAWVAVADVGEVRPGGPLTLFLNTNPLSPVKARVRSVAYEAAARPDAGIAHRIRASLAEAEDKPRLGLKGTARIDGDTVPLIWWAFRRPLATIRQFIGF